MALARDLPEHEKPTGPKAESPVATPARNWLETVAAILLGATAILTAWSGFESAKWTAAMSIAFSQAGTARVVASQETSNANAAIQADLTVYGQWLSAQASGDKAYAAFIEKRFSPSLAGAFTEWLATKPLTNAAAPAGPFVMAAYVQPATQRAAAANQRADLKFAAGLDANAKGDGYRLLMVMFALVMFFIAIAGRFKGRRIQWVLQGFGAVILIVGLGFLLSFPVLLP